MKRFVQAAAVIVAVWFFALAVVVVPKLSIAANPAGEKPPKQPQLYSNAPVFKPTTPASQTAACVQGQMVADASFIYVCTATNHWKRAALSDTAF